MQYQRELKVAIEAARRAGEEIVRIYESGFDSFTTKKEDESPLTIADTSANQIICATLLQSFPSIPILTEEEDGSGIPLDVQTCWVVDPLDGTKEFIQKNGQFTVNIALTRRHKSVLGVIYVPTTGVMYYATQGQGAYLCMPGEEKLKKIHVTEKLENLILVGSKSHSSEKEKGMIERHQSMISEVLSVGSSLKGCMVAEGKADVYYRFGYTCEWDTCAMQCIAEEAGAIFRQMDGSEMLYLRANHLNEKGFYIVNRTENIWEL